MSQKKRRQLKVVSDEKVVNIKSTSVSAYDDNDFLNVLKKYWWLMLLFLVTAIGIYVNGLAANFVSDDYASITQNPYITDFKTMWSGGNLASFSNYLLFNIFGSESTVPYHATNIMLYCIFIVVAFTVLMKIFGDIKLVSVTMALFTVLPVHVEAVTWISGRIYIIIAISIMLAFYFFLKFESTHNWRYLIGTALFFLMGFFTDKPRPFSLFLIILLYVFFKGFKNLKIDLWKFLSVTVAVGVLLIIVAIPYINRRIGIVNSGYNQTESIFYNPFFQYPTGLAKYFQILWLPFDLTLYHTMYTFPVWLNWVIFLLYVTMIVYFYFKNKNLFFALGFIFAAVFPSISPIKVSWLVAERYIFLGSLGFCLFLGMVFLYMYRYVKIVSVALLISMIGFYGFRVVLRNVDWLTNHNLWVNTCQVSPNSHNAWNNIGDDYDKLAAAATTDLDKSIHYANSVKGFTQSTLVKPNYADAYHNRANIFYKIGRLDLARDSYMTALNFTPNLYQTYLSLVQIDLVEQKYGLALEHSKKAVELQPDNPQAVYIYAVSLAESGGIEEAKNIFNQILARYPDFQLARDALVRLESGNSKK